MKKKLIIATIIGTIIGIIAYGFHRLYVNDAEWSDFFDDLDYDEESEINEIFDEDIADEDKEKER